MFTVEEIAADKGYISKRNLKLVDDLGATPYIPFKKNYIVPLNATNSIWNRMIRLYVYEREEFDAHYTAPRNKVEGSISIDKRVGGANLSAYTQAGQCNELFCRTIAYNLVRLVRVHYTSQDLIEVVDFGQLEPVYFNSEPLILPSQHATATVVGQAAPQCSCSVCQGRANPFWRLPGEASDPATHKSRRNGASNRTSDPVPDNVIYLFGRPNSPVN